ncbi:hypothetical protein MMC24_001733 [Lignoscripta atroalba]|nr:hypothetical protein [Lignoscripta atroalba]
MEGCDFYGCSPQVIVAAVNEVNDDGVVVDIPLDPDGNAAAANAAKTSEDEARINGALVTATMQAQQAVSTSLQLQAQQAASISLQAQQAASISLQAQAAQQVMSASLRAQQAQAAISNSIASAPAAAVTAPNTTAPISLTPPGPALPLNTVSASIESWQNQGEANCANWFDDDLQTATVAPAPAEVAEEIACIAYLESLDAQLAGELEANKKRRNRGRGVGRPSDNVDAWPTSKPYV